MNPTKPFEIRLAPFIGFGVYWDNFVFPLEINIFLPFVVISIGIGSYETPEDRAGSEELAKTLHQHGDQTY